MSESLRQLRQRVNWITAQMDGVVRDAQDRVQAIKDTHLPPIMAALEAAIQREEDAAAVEPPAAPVTLQLDRALPIAFRSGRTLGATTEGGALALVPLRLGLRSGRALGSVTEARP
jgi:hypothetical protein